MGVVRMFTQTNVVTMLLSHVMQVSTLHLFLMEVKVSLSDLTLSFTLKCEKQSQVAAFVKHFLQTLVAKDVLFRH